MPILRIPFCQPIESRKASLSADSYSSNCYWESRDQNTREAVSRPGYTQVTTIGSGGTAQGLYAFNSALYTAVANTLYKTTSGLTTTSLGTLSGSGSSVWFAESANNAALFLQDGTNGYVWNNTTLTKVDNTSVYQVTIQTGGTSYASPTCTFSAPTSGTTATGNVLYSGGVITGVAITNPGSGYTSPPTITFADGSGSGAAASVTLIGFPNGPLATGAVYFDGYTVVATQSGQIYSSDLETPTQWDPLNYITAESDPDPIVGIVKHFNYLVALGQWSTEFFYDAANSPGSPFLRQDSYKCEIGCADGNSIVQFQQAVIFVGKSKTHGKSVYVLDGVSPTLISTRYIDKYLNADTNTNLRAFAFKIEGHTFYLLSIPNLGVTFVYDMEEKQWYNWTSYNGSVESKFVVAYATEFNQATYGLDATTGGVYNISTAYSSDNGQSIVFRSVTSILDSNTTKRKFYRRGEVVGDKANVSMLIQFSDNDYGTYNTGRSVNLSSVRPQIYQLGQARRRSFQFLSYTTLPLRLLGFELEIDAGELEGDPSIQANR